MSAIVTYLSSQNDYNGTLYGYAKEQDITPAQATADAMEAAAAGDVVPQVIQRGSKSILTASLSPRAVRRINRANRKARSAEVAEAVNTALEASRPLKIGAIVEATGAARNEVLDVLRAGRDSENPRFYSFNTTGSNFHMSWSNEPSGETFPVPEPEPVAVEAAAEVEAEVSEDQDDAEGAEVSSSEE
jgi:hypothetical protein